MNIKMFKGINNLSNKGYKINQVNNSISYNSSSFCLVNISMG